jgi:hypothetical protein
MKDSARDTDDDAALRLRTITEAVSALEAALRESRAFPDIPEVVRSEPDEPL